MAFKSETQDEMGTVGWLNHLMEEAANYAQSAGLYDLQHEYRGVAEPLLREKAVELYGVPKVNPTTLREQQEVLEARRKSAKDRLQANSLLNGTYGSVNFDKLRHLPSWRLCSIAMIAVAICGFSHPTYSWNNWVLLVLIGALALLVLPMLPVFLSAVLQVAGSTAGGIRDSAIVLILGLKQARLESRLWAEETRRALMECWISEKLGLLLAEYEYNKALACRARLRA